MCLTTVSAVGTNAGAGGVGEAALGQEQWGTVVCSG